jgi:hypothetical protein
LSDTVETFSPFGVTLREGMVDVKHLAQKFVVGQPALIRHHAQLISKLA